MSPSRPLPICPICRAGPMRFACEAGRLEIYVCESCDATVSASKAESAPVAESVLSPDVTHG